MTRLEPDQIVKLVAVSGPQTFTALFDAKGRALGATGAQGAAYKLSQAGEAVVITVRLTLTAATTAASKAFEGALKLTFQLPPEQRESERAAAIAAAEAAAKELAEALLRRPALARPLLTSVGADGEVREADAFRATVAKLGVFDRVFEAVQHRLVAVAAHKLTAEGTLAPITAEDFPLDRVAISQSGGLEFSGGNVPVALGGAHTTHFVPTPARGGRRSSLLPTLEPTPTPPPTLTVFPVVSNARDVDGLAFLRNTRLVLAARQEFLGTRGPLDQLNLDSGAYNRMSLGFRNSFTNGVTQTQNAASDTVYMSGGVNGTTIYWYEPLQNPPATGVLATNNQGDRTYAIAAARSRVYVLPLWRTSSVACRLRAYDQSSPGIARDVRANGTAVQASKAYAMAVYDDGVASPVVFYSSQNDVLMVQDGGASAPYTLANFASEVRGLAFATPTLYVSLSGNRIVAMNVTRNPISSEVLLAAAGSATIISSAATDLRALSLQVNQAGAPVALYIGSSNNKILRVEFGNI
ncbi:MAG: hypothetical protein VKP62_00675 [Candidatus Sericytochromatia bacterium]|nr:hypothetical protein [Candidatus Sericytochromatia bacterium]